MKTKEMQKMSKKELYDLLAPDEQAKVKNLRKTPKAELISTINQRGSDTETPDTSPEEWDRDANEIVMKEGIMVKLNYHVWWGKSNRLREDELEVGRGRKAPKKIVGGTKTLVDPSTLTRFHSLIGYAKRTLDAYGFPFVGLRGIYWIPKDFIPEVDAKLKQTEKDFTTDKNQYILDYPLYVEEWRDVMKDEGVEDLYDDSIYPTPSELESKLVFKSRKFTISLPSPETGILSDEEYKEELKRQKEEAREFLDRTVTMVSQRFMKMVDTLQRAIGEGRGVKQKTLDNMKAFAETFDAMNVTNNKELRDLVRKAKDLLGDVDTKDDLKDKDIAKKVANGLDKIAADFKESSDKRLSRALEF